MAYEICIRVDDEGQISVGVEPQGEEGGEGVMMGSGGEQAAAMGEEGGEMEYKPAGSIKDALMMAMDIYANDGQVNGGEDEFNAGYGGGKKEEAPIREATDEDEERM